MSKEKKYRFYFSQKQSDIDEEMWNMPTRFVFVKTPNGYKQYSECCSLKGSKCNWSDAELVYETDDNPEIIVHEAIPELITELQHRLSNCIELPIPIGEKCWTINCYKTYGDVKKGEPYYATKYELHENIVSGYDIYKSMINDKLTLNVVPRAKTNYTGVQPYLYATEEEARAKLEEMKNGKV